MSELFETISKLSQSESVREYILVYQGDAFVIMHEINAIQSALTTAQEENRRLQDAYRTIEFISKYDGKDNNRRSMCEEFIFIKVKAMDCIDRIKKSKSVPNGENDE